MTCVDRSCATVQRVGPANHPCIGVEAVLASAERFDDPERATPHGRHAREPSMHATGNAGQAA